MFFLLWVSGRFQWTPLSEDRAKTPVRAIHIMNFIRAEEPRWPMDLVEPIRELLISSNTDRVRFALAQSM